MGIGLQRITRREAEVRYVNGQQVYIGTWCKADGGAWWKPKQFDLQAIGIAGTREHFANIARYFREEYCPGSRTRYAKDADNRR